MQLIDNGSQKSPEVFHCCSVEDTFCQLMSGKNAWVEYSTLGKRTRMSKIYDYWKSINSQGAFRIDAFVNKEGKLELDENFNFRITLKESPYAMACDGQIIVGEGIFEQIARHNFWTRTCPKCGSHNIKDTFPKMCCRCGHIIKSVKIVNRKTLQHIQTILGKKTINGRILSKQELRNRNRQHKRRRKLFGDGMIARIIADGILYKGRIVSVKQWIRTTKELLTKEDYVAIDQIKKQGKIHKALTKEYTCGPDNNEVWILFNKESGAPNMKSGTRWNTPLGPNGFFVVPSAYTHIGHNTLSQQPVEMLDGVLSNYDYAWTKKAKNYFTNTLMEKSIQPIKDIYNNPSQWLKEQKQHDIENNPRLHLFWLYQKYGLKIEDFGPITVHIIKSAQQMLKRIEQGQFKDAGLYMPIIFDFTGKLKTKYIKNAEGKEIRIPEAVVIGNNISGKAAGFRYPVAKSQFFVIDILDPESDVAKGFRETFSKYSQIMIIASDLDTETANISTEFKQRIGGGDADDCVYLSQDKEWIDLCSLVGVPKDYEAYLGKEGTNYPEAGRDGLVRGFQKYHADNIKHPPTPIGAAAVDTWLINSMVMFGKKLRDNLIKWENVKGIFDPNNDMEQNPDLLTESDMSFWMEDNLEDVEDAANVVLQAALDGHTVPWKQSILFNEAMKNIPYIPWWMWKYYTTKGRKFPKWAMDDNVYKPVIYTGCLNDAIFGKAELVVQEFKARQTKKLSNHYTQAKQALAGGGVYWDELPDWINPKKIPGYEYYSEESKKLVVTFIEEKKAILELEKPIEDKLVAISQLVRNCHKNVEDEFILNDIPDQIDAFFASMMIECQHWDDFGQRQAAVQLASPILLARIILLEGIREDKNEENQQNYLNKIQEGVSYIDRTILSRTSGSYKRKSQILIKSNKCVTRLNQRPQK